MSDNTQGADESMKIADESMKIQFGEMMLITLLGMRGQNIWTLTVDAPGGRRVNIFIDLESALSAIKRIHDSGEVSDWLQP